MLQVSQAEVVSNSSIRIHQTCGWPFCRALYIANKIGGNNDGAGTKAGAETKAGAGTKAGPGTSGTIGNVPVSASGSEEGPKTGTDADPGVGITAPLVLSTSAVYIEQGREIL